MLIFKLKLFTSLSISFMLISLLTSCNSAVDVEMIDSEKKFSNNYFFEVKKDNANFSVESQKLIIGETIEINLYKLLNGFEKQNKPAQWSLVGTSGSLTIENSGLNAKFKSLTTGTSTLIAKYKGVTKEIKIQTVNSLLANNVGPITVASGSGLIPVDVLINDISPQGDTIKITAINAGSNSAIVSIAADKLSISYQPDAAFYGVDTISYTIEDSLGNQSTANVIFHVMTQFTWTGAAANASWSDGTNWCGNVVAGSCAGGAAPGASDTAIFDGTCLTNCDANITASVNIEGLHLKENYSGTITQIKGGSQAEIISIGSAQLIQEGGIFLGGDADIIVYDFRLYGGQFTSTEGTLQFLRGMRVTEQNIFGHNNGTVRNYGCAGTTTYYEFNETRFHDFFHNNSSCGGTSFVNSTDHMIVENDLTLNGEGIAGGGRMDVYGDLDALYINGYHCNFSVHMLGNENQEVTGTPQAGHPSNLCNIIINKTGGTITFTTYLEITKSFTYNQGNVVFSPGHTLRFDGCSLGIRELNNMSSLPLQNLILNDTGCYGTDIFSDINLQGDLEIFSAQAIDFNSNTIYVGGDLDLMTTLGTSNIFSIELNGTSTQSIFQNSALDAFTGELIINNPAGAQLTSNFDNNSLNVTIQDGDLDLNGFDLLGLDDLFITASGSLTKNAGTLDYVTCSSGGCPADDI